MLVQDTTQPPSSSLITYGSNWLDETNSLTRTSGPTGLPSTSKRCWRIARPLPSRPELSCHTTTKPPSVRAAARAPSWLDAVELLTGNSLPTGVPSLSKSRAKTPFPLPSPAEPLVEDVQVTNTRPPSRTVTSASDCVLAVSVLTCTDAPSGVPVLSNSRRNTP